MPLPLIPVVAALSAGGVLVPHAAGGLIVSGVSGYMAGTYISTAALASFLAGTGAVAAVSLASVFGSISGAAAALLGGAGIFGTTVGATGVTGVLMSMGIIASVPIIVPVLIIALIPCLGFGGYFAYKFRRLNGRIQSAEGGDEMQFTESEAAVIERVIKSVSGKANFVQRMLRKISLKKSL